MHHTVIEINSDQFVLNIKTLKSYIQQQKDNVKFCLPVKANAYGHGLVGMAKIAEKHVDYFGVACLDEGITLRNNGISCPILVFGAFSDDQVEGLIANNLEITVSSLYKARCITEYCRTIGKIAKVHIKIDTGMNRIGVRTSSAKALIDYVLQQNIVLDLVGVYSHLASSDCINDTFTLQQIEKFTDIVTYVRAIKPNVICHLANSGGVCNYPTSYFDMVRTGITAYGYSSNTEKLSNKLTNIKPCFSLKSQVVYFKVVAVNSGISYSHKYITQNETRVVTIPIGYGDGYRRCLSNIGQVLIRGKRYTISGIICMDMLMVDIGYDGEAYVGDEVILIGHDGIEEITLVSMATLCDTIVYEILCGFNERIPRVYL